MNGKDNANMEEMRRHEGSTRQTILTLLKTKGPSHAGFLAKSLGITEMGVRRHLNTLEKDGFVKLSVVRQPMGRPSHVYALTESSAGLFPSNYHTLTLDLLEELDDPESGEPLIDYVFEGRKRKLLDRYGPRMAGKSLQERVNELADIQNSGGYMVEVESGRNSAFVFNEYNCPIARVADRYQQACRCELELFKQLLAADVERTECLAKGGSKCSYRIEGPARKD
ncbi:helix-turn-helix transcriptional regulator [Paenibacillus daejeonensis]|uniref:helix-turn-helix transcriptional regulator n=1 Tax=Paenibacillus daejeonensis TaxID=135193 RepID=UPI000372ABDC|nr:HTH domain-containing protein [Paenibacillus daejeonensis]